MRGTKGIVLLSALVLALLIAVPLVATDYVVYVVVIAMLYAMLTASYDIMPGFTGPLSFCPAAFYGIGAYACAILTVKLGLSFWLAMPLSVLGVGVFAALVGYPALKLRGHYFAVTTFFFGHFIYLVLLNSKEVTGGPMGFGGIRPPDSLLGIDFGGMAANYYLILVFTVLTVIFLYFFLHSGVGRLLVSIRENEDLAEAIGVNTAFFKVLAFSVSGAFAGLAGCLFAHFFRLLHPSTFAWMTSEMIVIMALVGGSGTLIGPLLGAGIVTFLLEFMRFAPELRFIIWSIALIVVLLVEPRGLVGIAQRIRGER